MSSNQARHIDELFHLLDYTDPYPVNTPENILQDLEYSPLINTRTNKNSHTLLYLACVQKKPDIVKALMEKGACPYVKCSFLDISPIGFCERTISQPGMKEVLDILKSRR